VEAVLRRLDRARYRTQQYGLRWNSVLMQEMARRFTRFERPPMPATLVREVRQRFRELLDRDLENVERGEYPRSLLFQFPLLDYTRALPALIRDAPRVARRAKKQHYQDIPAGLDHDRYPAYYRRTFHWQTDGYFSRHSAEVYDVGVELLFGGTADVMRRQVIPPVSRFLREQRAEPGSVRLLDVACGTGRMLKQLATAHPTVRYYGVDLSPYYAQAARKLLRDVAEVSLTVENAEHLPFVDGHFDVVTSVYLFHELPSDARRRVVEEMWRVLRPGGLLVIEDSAQLTDSPHIAGALSSFPERFHEPYYKGYVQDDLAAMLGEAGFAVESSDAHLVAKVVVARKPAN
jgi:ubiquinone/menaquinone biosynthesis C-methylase UbiE